MHDPSATPDTIKVSPRQPLQPLPILIRRAWDLYKYKWSGPRPRPIPPPNALLRLGTGTPDVLFPPARDMCTRTHTSCGSLALQACGSSRSWGGLGMAGCEQETFQNKSCGKYLY